MKILVLGDRIFGASSAYSKIAYETCTRLADMGHQIAHIPVGRSNRMGNLPSGKVFIYTSGNDPFAEDVALNHYVDFKADMLVTVKEPWCFNHIFQTAMNFVPMAIIDHAPISGAMLARLRTPFKVIAISRFGQRELKRNKIDSFYIPHGVRTDIYKPLEDKGRCKKLWFMEPDDFVVGIVALNRARKMIPRMLRIYKRFLELNPDVKAHLFLWTKVIPDIYPEETTFGVADCGVNLLPEIMELGLGSPPNDIRWLQPSDWDRLMRLGGIPDYDPAGGWDMVKLYNMMDVHLLCSGGEGFGMTLIEAQACGVPVITTNYAGGPEQVGAGITVPYSDYDVIATPGQRLALADIDKGAEALTKIYNADKQKLARRARTFTEKYDWNLIMKNYWEPFLDECELELFPKLMKEGGLTKW